ncbi:MAG: AAA family ATPase, partial [Bacteroidales bacterium]|nr:AAA family ATPase [Bacteroidales bacterium]
MTFNIQGKIIKRPRLIGEILQAIDHSPITGILGPRQCGKTTVSRIIAEKFKSTTFDLEDPVNLEQLMVAPKLNLEKLDGLVIIDEIQRMPELFPILRILVDRPENTCRFLILGSASPEIIKGASETLAGRIAFIDMTAFTLDEVGQDNYPDLWFRGGFPRSFLATDHTSSYRWRLD